MIIISPLQENKIRSYLYVILQFLPTGASFYVFDYIVFKIQVPREWMLFIWLNYLHMYLIT